MSIGSGIAIAAMWGAVGAIGWQNPGAAILVAIFAGIATLGVASADTSE